MAYGRSGQAGDPENHQLCQTGEGWGPREPPGKTGGGWGELGQVESQLFPGAI